MDKVWTNPRQSMDNHWTNFGPTSIEIIMDKVWTNPGQSIDQGMDKHLS